MAAPKVWIEVSDGVVAVVRKDPGVDLKVVAWVRHAHTNHLERRQLRHRTTEAVDNPLALAFAQLDSKLVV